MTALLLVAVAAAGGFGAVGRWLVDEFVSARWPASWPRAIAVVNLVGSLLLGLLTGLVASGLPPVWQVVLGTGFLGGFTTFSTASYQTVQLAQQGRSGTAAAYGMGVLVASVALAALGLVVGRGLAQWVTS